MWSAKYRAYGNLAALDVSEIDNPLRFQGQYFDAETGLHYNRHRYYNPNSGRFLTPDPIKLAGGLNNYLYVNNPTGWVDPLGLQECPGAGGSKSTNGEQSSQSKAKADQGELPPPTAASVKWKGFSSGKLQTHYQKHVLDQKEFGNISQAEYLNQAKAFAKESGNFNEAQVGNFIIKHDPATGRIFVGHLKLREIRTFYRDDGRSADAFQSAIDLAKGL
ncbi:hypothetical protein EMIT0162MI3_120004 [Pseudomonas chlororaphis]